jgi:hypothetical protein
MTKRSGWSKIITAHGVRVRLFERGGTIYRSVRVCRVVSGNGVPRTKADIRSMRHGDRRLAEQQARALCMELTMDRLVVQPVLQRVQDHVHRTRSYDAPSGASVYFLLNPDTGLVKIGYTTNLSRRWAALENGSGCALQLLATFDGELSLESRLHGEFREYRRVGEWFEYTGTLRAFIRGHHRKQEGQHAAS